MLFPVADAAGTKIAHQPAPVRRESSLRSHACVGTVPHLLSGAGVEHLEMTGVDAEADPTTVAANVRVHHAHARRPVASVMGTIGREQPAPHPLSHAVAAVLR